MSISQQMFVYLELHDGRPKLLSQPVMDFAVDQLPFVFACPKHLTKSPQFTLHCCLSLPSLRYVPVESHESDTGCRT
jgi:hypothetical protein